MTFANKIRHINGDISLSYPMKPAFVKTDKFVQGGYARDVANGASIMKVLAVASDGSVKLVKIFDTNYGRILGKRHGAYAKGHRGFWIEPNNPRFWTRYTPAMPTKESKLSVERLEKALYVYRFFALNGV
jgi:hypothetical protein